VTGGATGDGENRPVQNMFALLTPYERERLAAHTMYVGLKRGLTPDQMDQYAFNAALEMLKGSRVHAPNRRSIFHLIISLFNRPHEGRTTRR